MNGINLCELDDCTGCMACRQICPHQAISILAINYFEYPQINHDICVSCGLCVSVCPVLNKKGRIGNNHLNEKKCIAAWHKEDNVRLHSSSGGAFTAIAEQVLSDSGIVFGAAWDENLKLKHIAIDNIQDLDFLRRSKYVQSDVGNTFVEVRQLLKAGKTVLYSGTPCQIAGLKSFLGDEQYEGLITVDVVCQGVPSPYLFRKYINEIEEEKKCRIVDCNFRTKDKGWRSYFMLALTAKNKFGRALRLTRLLGNNSFYYSFIHEFFMRESCYRCPFKCEKQGYYSDLTIADFWRIGKHIPFAIDSYEKGVSAILLNTERGKVFFKKAVSRLYITERTWEEFYSNSGLRVSKKPVNNDTAFVFLQKHSWKETQTLFFPMSRREKIKSIALYLLGEKNIRILKSSFRR